MSSEQVRADLVHTSAAIRITGSKQEIKLALDALDRAGFKYRTNNTLYPTRDDPKRFFTYLNWLKVPALLVPFESPQESEDKK